MNRNRKLRKQMMSGLAVGMAAVMGAAPVYAATGEDAAVSKEETVYVNANADGSEDQITVSNWLKNAGTEKNLKDESELKDIKNVKGDEEFTQSGNELTWQTDGEDIYYQGTTTKEPPVSVKFTYYLDGKEIKPDDLAGKSGKLKIKVDYTNNTKTTVDINGKKETMYTPFVLMTGMILPQDTFSNVKIDNGKVISDGSRNIVIGFGMPGLQESLGLNSDSLEDLVSGDSDFELPESLEITADVENFSLDSTFTVALDDVLDTIDTDNITGYDDLKDALSDLEDAAMELVDGSKALSDGVDTLKDSYKELDDGIGTLCIPRQGTLSSPNRVIILMKQLQDTSLRFHNTFLNNSLTAAVLGEINCQSPFYRTYTSETQRTQILQDIISYIQYHSSESLKVTELARYFGYNDKYLSSLFHEGTGMTLKQFILKSKMDSAMAELTDTNHTVSQIAYNVGFQDAHNFSTAFRKLTGMTPGQYRKSYGNRKLSFE
jgi:AraC-like DNA-binding protein